MSDEKVGVSFVVPVRNGRRWLDAVLAAILTQHDGRPLEVLVVDDGSTDGSGEIARAYGSTGNVRVLTGEGRGAAAAINIGVRHASHPIICQVDQDVVLQAGWMTRVTAALLSSPTVGAVQGCYFAAPDAPVWARVMALDLALRYSAVRDADVDHVCTGNTAYRADALHRVNLFDEALGYGYDNDMSYRLAEAGYRLALCRDAKSIHRWREGARAYLVQQYGFGYGRLDLVFKHRRRWTGDDVSGATMILHAPLMLAALLNLSVAFVLKLAGTAWLPFVLTSVALLALLAGERCAAGLRASVRFRDPSGLWFTPIHLLRDVAWALALTVWVGRRVLAQPARPSHSMSGHGDRHGDERAISRSDSCLQ